MEGNTQIEGNNMNSVRIQNQKNAKKKMKLDLEYLGDLQFKIVPYENSSQSEQCTITSMSECSNTCDTYSNRRALFYDVDQENNSLFSNQQNSNFYGQNNPNFKWQQYQQQYNTLYQQYCVQNYIQIQPNQYFPKEMNQHSAQNNVRGPQNYYNQANNQGNYQQNNDNDDLLKNHNNPCSMYIKKQMEKNRIENEQKHLKQNQNQVNISSNNTSINNQNQVSKLNKTSRPFQKDEDDISTFQDIFQNTNQNLPQNNQDSYALNQITNSSDNLDLNSYDQKKKMGSGYDQNSAERQADDQLIEELCDNWLYKMQEQDKYEFQKEFDRLNQKKKQILSQIQNSQTTSETETLNQNQALQQQIIDFDTENQDIKVKFKSAFKFFKLDKIQYVKMMYPNVDYRQRTSILKSMWKSLAPDQRLEYVKLSRIDRQREISKCQQENGYQII